MAQYLDKKTYEQAFTPGSEVLSWAETVREFIQRGLQIDRSDIQGAVGTSNLPRDKHGNIKWTRNFIEEALPVLAAELDAVPANWTMNAISDRIPLNPYVLEAARFTIAVAEVAGRCDCVSADWDAKTIFDLAYNSTCMVDGKIYVRKNHSLEAVAVAGWADTVIAQIDGNRSIKFELPTCIKKCISGTVSLEPRDDDDLFRAPKEVTV